MVILIGLPDCRIAITSSRSSVVCFREEILAQTQLLIEISIELLSYAPY